MGTKGWADVIFAGFQDPDAFWEIGKNFDQIVEISPDPGEITFLLFFNQIEKI